jgi:mycothiol synthase
LTALSEFARLIRRHDGVDAFNELSRIALDEDSPPTARVRRVVEDGTDVVAVAVAVGDAPVDMAVHPERRRRGHATAMLDTLLRQGERRFWAHGDLPAARSWAALLGLKRERTLLRLTAHGIRPATGGASHAGSAWGMVTAPATATIRRFREDDLDGLLAVNARAFAEHPEQRAMDRADFRRRASSDWFDPAGLFVAEQGGSIVGFHWTKVDEGMGEVYVLAVDPDHHGAGLGGALLTRGLNHLAEVGVNAVDLYVEEENARALDLYTAFGFAEVGRDVLYVSTKPEATAPDPS